MKACHLYVVSAHKLSKKS